MHRFFLSALAMLIVCCLVTTTGCGGCRSDESTVAERKKMEREKKKKPKPNFRSPGTAIMPGMYPRRETLTTEELAKLSAAERATYQSDSFLRRNRTKIGHWVATATPVVANNFDVQGQIELTNVNASGKIGSPLAIPRSDFSIITERPFGLVRGQWKTLQSSAYLVPRVGGVSANLQLDFLPTSGGMPVFTAPMCVSRLMKGFQYHMVLLTNRPRKMQYLKLTDSVRVADNDRFASGSLPESYFVVENTPDMPLPLPGNALQWTTIAYVIWDDLEPSDLDLNQQQALVDWLHFGGQLVISGADSLAKFESSFLADYLPAQSQQRVEIEKVSFDTLNRYWSVPNEKNPAETRRLTVVDGEPVIGVEFKPHVSASFIEGTGDLVVERRVGRGRIVATAFSLSEPRVRSWPSFQTFFSGALLRRPSRQFGRNSADVLSYRWADDGTSIFDPLIGSAVRFTSRDLGFSSGSSDGLNNDEVDPMEAEESAAEEVAETQPAVAETGVTDPSPEALVEDQADQSGLEKLDDERAFDGPLELSVDPDLPVRRADHSWWFGGYRTDPTAGVAGWSDNSAIASAARSTLKTSAGITPPSAELVWKLLGAYLIVLVPLNWAVFRLFGKIEWAWIAVPVISIAGAFTVVRMASLDIGFARSNTQVALLELHSNYARGHLSQYSALYTSLSTKYEVELDNATGIALPFPAGNRMGKRGDRTVIPVTLQQSIVNRLENFLIQSNSTRLMHTECLFDAGGSFELVGDVTSFGLEVEGKSPQAEMVSAERGEGLTLENSTAVNLNSAAVIARDWNGQYYYCQLGVVDAGAVLPVELTACEATDFLSLWGLGSRAKSTVEKETTNTVGNSEPVSAAALMKKVVDYLTLGRGEIRLLGYCDQRVSQTRFIPASTQTREQTLVLVHLKPAELPPVKRDLNSISDFLVKHAIGDELNDDDVIAEESFDGTE